MSGNENATEEGHVVKQAAAGAGDEPPSPKTEFKWLLDRQKDPGMRNMLLRHQEVLVKEEVTCETTLRALTYEQLKAAPYSLPDGAAVMLKAAFPTPSPPRSGPGSPNKVASDKGSGGAPQAQQANPAAAKRAPTVALGNSSVKIASVFINITQQFCMAEGYTNIGSLTDEVLGSTVPACDMPVLPEVLQYMAARMVVPYFRHSRSMSFGTEAPMVHLTRLALQEAAMLCGASIDVGGAVEDQTVVEQVEKEWRVHDGPFKAAMEKTLRVPGLLGGRIEHQCLIKGTDGEALYAGACEVGVGLSGGALANKIEQAMKECVCMWLCNASRKHFKSVWVLLSDGLSIMRIEFVPKPGPQGQWPDIKPNMLASDIYGQFRCTPGVQLFDNPQRLNSTATTVQATLTILGAFLKHVPDPPQDVEQLKARIDAAEKFLAKEISLFWQHATTNADQNTAREELVRSSKRLKHK